MKTSNCINRSLATAFILLISIGLYLPTLQYGFVYDDKFQILENKWITDIKYLPDIFTSSFWSFDHGAKSNIYRPVHHILYMLEYRLFGLKPWGYHLVNIIVHTVNSLIVFFLASLIFKNPKRLEEDIDEELTPVNHENIKKNLPPYAPAFTAALLFAVHPVNTESVSWIGTLPELFMTSLYLLSFYFYMTCLPGFNLKFFISVLLFFIAIFLKEPAVTLIFVILLYDCSKKGIRSVIKGYKRYIPYISAVMVYMGLRVHALEGFTVKRDLRMGFDQLILNIFPLFFQYVEKLFLPFDLRAIYVFYPVDSLFNWAVISTITFTIIFIACWYKAAIKMNPVFYGCTFIFIPLIPVFYLPLMRDTVFADRYIYLSSFGFALSISYILEKVSLNLSHHKHNRVKINGNFIIISLIILLFFIILSGKRMPVWESDFTLWSDTVKKSPDSYVAHNDLGIALGKKGMVKEAFHHFSEALKIEPDNAETYSNFGIVLFANGHAEDAVLKFSEAIRIDPKLAKAHYNLGFVLAEQKKIDNAIFHFKEALRIQPDYPKAQFNLRIALEK